MLTRYGWMLLVAAVALVVAGRLFGIVELYVLGAMAGLLPFVALAYVRTARLQLRVTRVVTPARVHAGDTTRVEVAALNRARRRTPVLQLRDPVGGTRGAQLHLAPLVGGETARAAYRLPTTHRGVVAVGPLTVEVADPFGLCSRTVQAAPLLELTVFPKIDRVAAPKGGGDRNPHGVAVHHNAVGRQGDDFYALREYVVGDDLRRVDWKSSARADELMVRQDEMPWQDRTTVVLDLRRAAHDADSLERAVSAAASVLITCAKAGHLLRLVATDGTDSGSLGGLTHVDGLLELLARAELSGSGSLRAELDALARSGTGGIIVAAIGRTTGGELEALARLQKTHRRVVTVVTNGHLPEVPRAARGLLVVDARRDDTFAGRWATLVANDRAEVPA